MIFICTFDPFGQGLSRYTFHERCDEDLELCLDDGTEKVFYNCKYEGEDIPDGIRNLYEWLCHNLWLIFFVEISTSTGGSLPPLPDIIQATFTLTTFSLCFIGIFASNFLII